jgi:hypothetical protein
MHGLRREREAAPTDKSIVGGGVCTVMVAGNELRIGAGNDGTPPRASGTRSARSRARFLFLPQSRIFAPDWGLVYRTRQRQ